MFIDITEPDRIVEINTSKDVDGFYLIEVVFDNDHVIVYGFPNLEEFMRSYTDFINKYRGR